MSRVSTFFQLPKVMISFDSQNNAVWVTQKGATRFFNFNKTKNDEFIPYNLAITTSLTLHRVTTVVKTFFTPFVTFTCF